MIRTKEEWAAIFRPLPSPSNTLVEENVANRVLSDLVGYRQNSPHRVDDARNLGNAIEAYHQLLKEWGL